MEDPPAGEVPADESLEDRGPTAGVPAGPSASVPVGSRDGLPIPAGLAEVLEAPEAGRLVPVFVISSATQSQPMHPCTL